MAVNTVKATLNGQTYNLTYNSSTGAYEATITAPTKSSYNQTNHVYGITVVATDTAGNSTTIDSGNATYGAQLKLKVTESTKPVITVTYPTNNAVLTSTDTPTISWKVTDADSGVNASTITLKIDGTAVSSSDITKTNSSGTYTCTCVKTLSQGAHTLVFEVTDNDGNKQTSTISIKVDTVPPTLNISSPSGNITTNVTNLTVSGYTNDANSSPVTLTVNGSATTVHSNGYFETTVALTEGSNKITVVAKDASGLTTRVERTVKLDTKAPKFTSVTCTPNPVGVGGQFKISVNVTDE